ncbi:META domain-containing protein [Leucobacter chromiireducens]|uniref:META domain-containing protein n=1 Tax=Leucobacter chromiireducens subsp. solipictus TaxID=398235 RepID=A0ABS1SJV1_9MICO|nr:META domain-containing protein [Leucobacter chromiireducens]MBL3680131.1 META domain-containing protein [Leucobacter chromiireducens subsp. solipictus]
MRRTKIITATLAAAALFALTGCASSASFVGTWTGSGSEAPQLEIAEDGEFSGTDGCNRLMGKAEIADDTLEFGQFASTRKFCEDVDTWLSTAGSATVSGDTLTVLDADGKEVGTLTRQ